METGDNNVVRCECTHLTHFGYLLVSEIEIIKDLISVINLNDHNYIPVVELCLLIFF